MSKAPGQHQQQQQQRDIESGEQTPLLGRPVSKQQLLRKELAAESIQEKAVAGIAGCGFITSLLSILFESHPSAILSGIMGLILSPYAVSTERHDVWSTLNLLRSTRLCCSSTKLVCYDCRRHDLNILSLT
jgi:hypothetical protein